MTFLSFISSNLLHNYFKLRVLPSSSSTSSITNIKSPKGVFWHHKGSLKSSVTGEEIAGIEGLEYISISPTSSTSTFTSSSSSSSTSSSSSSTSTFSSYFSTSSSSLPSSSSSPSSPSNFSLLSQKIFAYVDPNSRNQLLKEKKMTPVSPSRPINYIKSFTYKVDILPIDSSISSSLSSSTITPTSSPSTIASPDTSQSNYKITWPSGRESNNLITIEENKAKNDMKSKNNLKIILKNNKKLKKNNFISFASPTFSLFSSSFFKSKKENPDLSSNFKEYINLYQIEDEKNKNNEKVYMKIKKFNEDSPYWLKKSHYYYDIMSEKYDNYDEIPEETKNFFTSLLSSPSLLKTNRNIEFSPLYKKIIGYYKKNKNEKKNEIEDSEKISKDFYQYFSNEENDLIKDIKPWYKDILEK